MTGSEVFEATKKALQAAMAGLRQGRLADAKAAIAAGLAQGADPLVLNELFGLELSKSGQALEAVPFLRRAFSLQPNDPGRAANLVTALIAAEDLEGALEVANEDHGLANSSDRLLNLRAYSLQQLERFEEAASDYRRLVERRPDDFEAWNNLGNVLSAMETPDESVVALRRAFELQPSNGPVALNLAASLVAAGSIIEAESVLQALLKLVPTDGRAWIELAAIQKLLGQNEDAAKCLQRAVDLSPWDPDLWLKLGVELQDQHRLGEAEAALRKAISLDPGMAEAYLLLALLLEHINQTAGLKRLAEDVERHVSDQNLVWFLQAMVHWRNENYQKGLDVVSEIEVEFEPIRTTHLKAQFLDRLGKTDEAFANYALVNELHKKDPENPEEKARLHRVQLVEQLSLVNAKWVEGWTPPHPFEDQSPVFLVGFPRSGTTLLDTVLMGHPRVAVLEEKPTIRSAELILGSMERLAGLDLNQIEALRVAYFDEVRRWTSKKDGMLLIDKSPLYLNKVPHIMRLFPKARFILALRHPLDVILSCYITNFRLNSGMSNFLSLDTSAEMYNLSLSNWRNCVEVFKPDVFEIRYENLIVDSESAIRPLIEWLGLDWQRGILDHQTTALARGTITTASYAQVTEPIYQRSKGRWERYRDQLAPIMPVIRPWADRFGYEL